MRHTSYPAPRIFHRRHKFSICAVAFLRLYNSCWLSEYFLGTLRCLKLVHSFHVDSNRVTKYCLMNLFQDKRLFLCPSIFHSGRTRTERPFIGAPRQIFVGHPVTGDESTCTRSAVQAVSQIKVGNRGISDHTKVLVLGFSARQGPTHDSRKYF